MTKFLLAITLTLAAVSSVRADESARLDPVSRMSLRQPVHHTGNQRLKPSAGVAVPTNLALVRLNDGTSADDLVADGFDAVGLRAGYAVVSCLTADADRLVGHPAVRQCEFNRRRSPLLDMGRQSTSVDMIHSATGIDLPLTGAGVVTAIVDAGFDPNHINFTDSDGNSRIKYFSTVEVSNSGSGIRTTPYTPDQLVHYTTDDNTTTHGTHTLGIMSGSYRGNILAGIYDHATDAVSVVNTANPFYGVAPDGIIYASTGMSYDALIAYAIDGILEHRWYNDHDAPVVFNLSLGGNQGPHDGNGMLCQFIDAVSQSDGAIFCISSGNEGDMPIALNKTFTDDDTQVATFVRPFVYNDLRYGIVEIYSDSDMDFDISVIIYNKARQRVARTFPLNNKQGQIQYICSGADYAQDESDIIDATFARAYDGYVGVAGMIDPESGRFKAAVDYYVVNADGNPADDNTEAQYTLGFLVTGHPGQRIDCFCDGEYTALDSYGYPGYSDGSRNGSISDVATARSAIAVGSYNTRRWAGGILGDALGYNDYFKLGEVTEFSSYGSLVDGRSLPHVLAPGCSVVSSISTPYCNNPANNVSQNIITAKLSTDSRDHYFQPMMGTSMASPMTAGVVALMLEANPRLDASQVREILMSTAVVEDGFLSVEDSVQYGAGRIDALAAVKMALRGAGIAAPVPDSHNIIITPVGRSQWQVFAASAPSVDVDVYNIGGAKVMSASNPADQCVVDLSALTPGIYFITVNNITSRRIAIM